MLDIQYSRVSISLPTCRSMDFMQGLVASRGPSCKDRCNNQLVEHSFQCQRKSDKSAAGKGVKTTSLKTPAGNIECFKAPQNLSMFKVFIKR